MQTHQFGLAMIAIAICLCSLTFMSVKAYPYSNVAGARRAGTWNKRGRETNPGSLQGCRPVGSGEFARQYPCSSSIAPTADSTMLPDPVISATDTRRSLTD